MLYFVLSSEHLSEQVMFLMFWAAACVGCCIAIYHFGKDFVDKPRLIQSRLKYEWNEITDGVPLNKIRNRRIASQSKHLGKAILIDSEISTASSNSDDFSIVDEQEIDDLNRLLEIKVV